jgi:hypothetical protein
VPCADAPSVAKAERAPMQVATRIIFFMCGSWWVDVPSEMTRTF